MSRKSIVYRLSSTVYRLPSIVYRLGFSTCQEAMEVEATQLVVLNETLSNNNYYVHLYSPYVV